MPPTRLRHRMMWQNVHDAKKRTNKSRIFKKLKLLAVDEINWMSTLELCSNQHLMNAIVMKIDL
jgi:hypothetical protein